MLKRSFGESLLNCSTKWNKKELSQPTSSTGKAVPVLGDVHEIIFALKSLNLCLQTVSVTITACGNGGQWEKALELVRSVLASSERMILMYYCMDLTCSFVVETMKSGVASQLDLVSSTWNYDDFFNAR